MMENKTKIDLKNKSIASLLIPVVTMQIQQAVFRYLLASKSAENKTLYVTGSLVYIGISSVVCYPIVYLILRLFKIDSLSAVLICLLFLSEALYSLLGQIVRGLGYNAKYSVSVVVYVHVVNELDVPILCMGLKDVVVSASPGGILVSDKEQSSYIKPFVNMLDHQVIQAGTVHAIGAGALVAEIQENSNLTYRLYDYDRVGKDGKKRELHVDKALQVANLKSSAEPRQPLRVLKYRQGVASELLTRCKYFEVYRMIVNTERRQKVHYRADEIAFRVLLCVNGCGTISYEGGNLPFYKGDCIFVPADSEVLTIHGQAQFLDVRG